MLGNIGFGELLLIGLIALLLFGPSKLPELGRSLGRTIREFKQGARDLLSDEPPEAPRERKDVTPPESPTEPPQAPPKPADADGQQQAKQADHPTEPPQAPPKPANADGQQAKQADRQDSRRLPD